VTAGPHVLACSVGHGDGGLGQHFAQVVEAARADGSLHRYYTPRPRADDAAAGVGVAVAPGWFPLLARYTPARFSPAWLNRLGGELFDRAVAARLAGSDVAAYTGFGGQSLHSFGVARRLGAAELGLLAANSHVDNVAAQHAKAIARWPIESSWLNAGQIRKTRREYEMADVILVASEYTRQTFLARGVPEAKLRRVHYATDARFQPPADRPTDGVFRVVTTGSLSVVKGIPALVEAFAKLAVRDAELTLVGGWSTRGMRRYLQAAMARDPRIKLAPGDPLPQLHRADVYVHPSYEDGHAYAPMEALATGLPVVVTEDTGMKEHVREGQNGYVVPTGDVAAITDRLDHLAGRR
jgi:glycosyltransferase involved in cell wall biosynthesis